MFKKSKPQVNSGTAIWINEVGAMQTRIFKILEVKDKKIHISFGKGEKYLIKESHLRAKRIIIYKTSSGKIITQDPEKWKDIGLKDYGIKELRFNLQNFSLQESKAAIHRWTTPKDMMDKLSPLFKLLFICIAISVIGWAILKFGVYVLQVVMDSRLLDCSAIVPKVPVPIDVITTTPIIPIGT